MQVEPFVSNASKPCRDPERIYGEIASGQGIKPANVDIVRRAASRAQRLGIELVPALGIYGRQIAIGTQPAVDVRDLFAAVHR